MLKAEQHALIQGANQQLLNIRQSELQFFVKSYETLGTMAALIAGFTLATVTAFDVQHFTKNDIVSGIYWVTSAATMATSLHCVLTATLINIFAPGLALRGPAGSMVRTIEGMRSERNAIFFSFYLSIAFFSLMTISCCWVLMKFRSASISTGLLLVGCYFWYNYLIRIYNRFYFTTIDDDAMHEPSEPNASSHSGAALPPIAEEDETKSDRNTLVTQSGGEIRESNGLAETASDMNLSQGSQKSALKILFKKPPVAQPAPDPPLAPIPMTTLNVPPPTAGYITLDNAKSLMRRYFIVQDHFMNYYTRKEDFETDILHTLNRYPIDLTGYEFEYVSPEGVLPYGFTIRPQHEDDERRVWKFRCDTHDEMCVWLRAFRLATVCDDSFSHLYISS